MKTLISGGEIVLHSGTFLGDLLIEGERIAAVGSTLNALGPFDQTIDAIGKLILPGLIDAHVHMPWNFAGVQSTDNFTSGTRAAICGGTTMIIDFAIPENGESLSEAIRKRQKAAERSCYTDFGFHVIINHFNETLMEEIPKAVAAGVPSFSELYTLYPGLKLHDGEIYQILQWVKQAGGLVGIHAENGEIIDLFTSRFAAQNKLSPYYHYLSRPGFVEATAVQRIISLNQIVGGHLYFVHVSSGESLKLISRARHQGQRVYVETCPHYLLLTAEKYKESDGHLFFVSPSLKTAADRAALWEGIKNGQVDFISTDHCPFSRVQKEKHKDDFTRAPNGLPGVETRLALLVTEGYRRRHVSLEKIVQLTSYNPARIFGLYPRKGTLQPGADADLVIFDPDADFAIESKKLHMNVDWSPYNGYRCRGWPRLVMRRGEVLYREGEWLADSPRGEFIERVCTGRLGPGRDIEPAEDAGVREGEHEEEPVHRRAGRGDPGRGRSG